MKTYKKIIWTVAIVLVVVIGFAVVNHGGAPKADRPLTLGLMLPLSGDYAVAGQNYQKGVELALAQYQVAHPNSKIKIVVEDDGFEVKKGVSAYRKLMDFDKVDAIMMLSTPVIDAIHEDVVKTGIPVLQLGVQTVGVADDNIFQMSPAAEAPIGYLAQSLTEDKNFYSKKVAVVYDNSVGTITFYNAFKNAFKHDFTPLIVGSKGDLRGYAIKIAADNYDAVVMIESPENGALLTKELLAVDKTMPELVYDAQLQTGFGDYKRILGDANKINGAKSMWFKAGKVDEFKSAFKQKYNEEPGFLADFGYDIFNTAVKTYSDNDKTWVSNLQNTNNPDGVSGGISFDKNGVRIQPMVLTQVQGGELKPIQ